MLLIVFPPFSFYHLPVCGHKAWNVGRVESGGNVNNHEDSNEGCFCSSRFFGQGAVVIDGSLVVAMGDSLSRASLICQRAVCIDLIRVLQLGLFINYYRAYLRMLPRVPL